MLIVLTPSFALAQKTKPVADTTFFWKNYRNAMSFGDLQIAKSALFDILVLQPDNKLLYDSLAHIYFHLGAYDQAIQAADSAISNRSLREIRAYSYRKMGDIKSALPLFEMLFTGFGTPEYGYQTALLQFTIRRYGECEETIDKIMLLPESKTSKVVLTMEQGESMQVSYLAASLNLKGALHRETGKKELARLCFENALSLEPGFTLARNNIKSLEMPPGEK